ncbi:extensin family protein [Mesorhizobium sp. KR1-2]|uniref:extensin family protein n=1 Tax=Mesorhizobium sp. KR1-2 TaxID=3156609 RepID=UPI0032B3C866
MKLSPLGMRAKFLPLTAAALLCVTATDAKPPRLPNNVPVPEVFSPPAGNILPEKLGDTPLPEPRPKLSGDPDNSTVAGEASKPDAGAPVTPEKAPLPEQRPAQSPPSENGKESPGSEDNSQEKRAPAPLPAPRSSARPSATMPAEEIACRKRLVSLGVSFEERPSESDPEGCAVPYPLAVKTLGKAIDIAPDVVMNCAMAEAVARFATDSISPAAQAAYGEELKSVSDASGYACRPRNGTTTLSEHAFGNALDIGRFTLSKGTEVDVVPAPEEKAAKFLADIRKAACGPFKTVLGPGSDADHTRHLHLDLAPRKHGATFCQ